MNPDVQTRVQRITDTLEDLRLAVRNVNAALDRQQEEREKLVQDQWRKSKMLATLQHSAEDFQALKAELESLKARRQALKEHLRRLRNYSKALAAELRS
jgi:cell division protein FtsB